VAIFKKRLPSKGTHSARVLNGRAFDTAIVQRLIAICGSSDSEFGIELYFRFIRDTEERIAAMSRALSRTDREIMVAAPHALRGAAMQFGAVQIAAICAGLEDATRAGEIMKLGPLIEQLAAETARLRTELNRRLAHMPHRHLVGH